MCDNKEPASHGRKHREWLHTTTREELRRTIGWGHPRRVHAKHTFSVHHPTIPRRYVPEWQSDMRNRTLIAQNCKLAGSSNWKGHVSYFLNGRERISATNYTLHDSVLQFSRHLHGNSSHLSKFNSSMMLIL